MLNVLLSNVTKQLGWITVQNGRKIDYDLENTPLQIETNSEVGSNEEVRVWYFDDKDQPAGGISLRFMAPPRNNIWHCSPNTYFPHDLPPDTEKIWTLSLTRSTSVRIVIYCNDVEVLNFVLSDTTCTNEDVESWGSRWDKEVASVRFTQYNTAADYYRPGEEHTVDINHESSQSEQYSFLPHCPYEKNIRKKPG